MGFNITCSRPFTKILITALSFCAVSNLQYKASMAIDVEKLIEIDIATTEITKKPKNYLLFNETEIKGLQYKRTYSKSQPFFIRLYF